MGRRPAKDPKGIHLGLRIDSTLDRALDLELKRENAAKAGLTLQRSDIVRMLLTEALEARAQRRGKK